MKLLVASDLHIDSPMRGLAQYDQAPVAEVRGATRAAFSNLVATAIEERVDIVVLAGDVFDGDWQDFNTGLFFVSALGVLRDADIPVVVLYGNHDACSQITRRLVFPPNTHVLPAEAPGTVVFDNLGIAVHGQSFATRAVRANLAAGYPAPVPGLLNVGTLHTALTGRTGHHPYAPCQVDDLRAKEYGLWALGHVHEREVVHEDPLIVFPGNVQGRSAREVGPKGATIVHANGHEITAEHHVDLDVVRWTLVDVDATGSGSLEEILDRVEAGLEDAERAAGGRLVAARVILSGATPIHARLRVNEERVGAEVRALASGRLWVEKVRIGTEATSMLTASGADVVSALQRTVESVRGDDAALADLVRILEPLRSKLPASAAALDGIDLADPACLQGLVAEAGDLAVALLDGQDPR